MFPKREEKKSELYHTELPLFEIIRSQGELEFFPLRVVPITKTDTIEVTRSVVSI